jgi:putative ABC transport system substrate-binding protein
MKAGMTARVLPVLLALGLLAAALGAAAQPAGKVPRIGALVTWGPGEPTEKAFRQGLRDLGYVEGRNITVEYRYAEGRPDRHGDLAAEAVRLEPDVIVVWGTEFAQMAQRATRAIPVVFAVADRPVEMGLVATLARPGGKARTQRQDGAAVPRRRPGWRAGPGVGSGGAG